MYWGTIAHRCWRLQSCRSTQWDVRCSAEAEGHHEQHQLLPQFRLGAYPSLASFHFFGPVVCSFPFGCKAADILSEIQSIQVSCFSTTSAVSATKRLRYRLAILHRLLTFV